MTVWDGVFLGLSAATTVSALLYCLTGVTLGTFVGVLPGIGSLAAISMLMPISFHLEPQNALIMLAGVYYGALYGGSTASILLNLPGSPSSAVACLDGYPMAQQGRAGLALSLTTIASFVGASAGIVLMIAFSPLIASVGLGMTAADYFALLLLGLVAASTIASGSPVRGIAMVVTGITLGLVGTDVQTGQHRFTFGSLYLADGINLVALSIGLFGIPEIISNLSLRTERRVTQTVTLRSMIPSGDDLRRSWMPMLRGIGLGSFVGALPGAGTNIAAFMTYAFEKNLSRTPERFGKGAIEGVVAPETSNNAAAQTAFVPTMSLGIPGDATMALLLGVLIMHGIQPGPRLVSEQPVMFWSLIMSFWVGNILLVVLNLPLIGLWVQVLNIPRRYLMPSIIALMSIGVFSINGNPLDVLTMAVAGLAGYVLRLGKFEPAPLILGFILGPLMEQYFRRAYSIARGDLLSMVSSPSVAAMLGLSAVIIVLMLWRARKRAGTAAVRTRSDVEDVAS